MIVAEVFVSAFVGMLFTRLSSPEFIKFTRQLRLKKKLDKWRETLEMLQAVRRDAEEKQLTETSIRLWLNELSNLAYDVEDILDEFDTEALRYKSKAQKHLKIINTRLDPRAIKFHVKMVSKIKEITSRFEGLTGQTRRLGLQSGQSVRNCLQRTPSTCLANQHGIHGRDEEKERILDELASKAVGNSNYQVIPIVGMAGVGKTALAQLVYNDKAAFQFHPKVWVCVSRDFDVMRIAKNILESITCRPCELTGFNQVQVKLREALAKQKFLLVLDDVWNKDYGLWEALQSPFAAGAPGSKIIVTTRCIDAALTMCPSGHYLSLEPLSDDNCWLVFLNHVFKGRKVDHPQLDLIREKVLEKCKGLPLTARSLGGLLRSKPMKEWMNILSRPIWNILGESDMLTVLKLRYYHLPSHLKRCFAYCALLPKGYEFEQEELVLLWMAEGLIPQSEGGKQMEELAGEYFREFVSMSIFQVSSSSRSLYVMHNLINDVARWAAGEKFFHVEDSLVTNETTERFKRLRHFSYIRDDYDGMRKFEAIWEAKSTLRTFLPFRHGDSSYITTAVLGLLPRLKRLHVLSLCGYNICELPNEIGDLKQLRHLDLSRTLIRSLPEPVTSLRNLLTLILRDCSHLSELPSGMENLINLQYLDLRGAYLLVEMPSGLSKLSALRKLSDFFVRRDVGCGIEELKTFNFLRGRLCISNLENVADARRAMEANLNVKQDLDSLVLKWKSDFSESRKDRTEKDVLDMLRPHSKLKKLTISCYAGRDFPSWVTDSSFSNIVFVRLENCENCTSLPPLGLLQSLKDLFIVGMSGVQGIGPEIYGKDCSNPFPSLETLHLESMPEWQEWHANGEEQVEVFPCLRELSISRCSNLVGNLPAHLPSLELLVVHECQQLSITISGFPTLRGLDVRDCKEVLCRNEVYFNSLKSILLSNVSFTFLVEDFIQGLKKVETMVIVGCEELETLWKNQGGLLSHLEFLRCLRIKSCSQLVSLFTEDDVEQQQIGLQCSLEILELLDCGRLEQPIALWSVTSLQELHIENSRELVSFLPTSWPSTLRRLYVSYCENLKCLLDERTDTNFSDKSLLEYLDIRHCASLQLLSSSRKLPTALKHIEIFECPELDSIAETFCSNIPIEHIEIRNCRKLVHLHKDLDKLISLQEVTIFSCPNIGSFPEGGLPTTNLRKIYIGRCEKLESLPKRMHAFSSLRELDIHDCPRINSFEEVGFPTNLTSLSITKLTICGPLFAWGLHRLTSLQQLFITGGCPEMICFPDDKTEMMLPTSLTSLSLADFPSLKYLCSRGFQNLNLLQELSISNCPKLKYLPKKGLPTSMLELYIHGCPLLKEQCERDRGQEFSKIAHIPFVYIDNKFIYDQEEEG